MDKWVSEGIISQDQADSIHEYERQVAPSRGSAIEVLGYLGAALAASAGFMMASGVWSDLSRTSRVALVGVAAIALVIIGEAAARGSTDVIRRLGAMMLMLAVPVIGAAIAIAVDTWGEPRLAVVIASGGALMAAAIMYGQRQSSPQHIALFLASLSLAFSGFMFATDGGSEIIIGSVILGVGLIWVILAATDTLPPRLVGEILGALTALAGSSFLAATIGPSAEPVAVALIAIAIVGIAFGVTRGHVPLTIAGATGVVIFVPWLATEIFGSDTGVPIAPMSIFVVGAVLAAWAIYRARKTLR